MGRWQGGAGLRHAALPGAASRGLKEREEEDEGEKRGEHSKQAKILLHPSPDVPSIGTASRSSAWTHQNTLLTMNEHRPPTSEKRERKTNPPPPTKKLMTGKEDLEASIASSASK